MLGAEFKEPHHVVDNSVENCGLLVNSWGLLGEPVIDMCVKCEDQQ